MITLLSFALPLATSSGLGEESIEGRNLTIETTDLPLSADQAYNFGCFTLADQLYRRLLDSALAKKDFTSLELVYRRLGAIAIGRGDFNGAANFLRQVKTEDDPLLLMKAIASLGENRLDEEALARITVDNLRPREKSWYYTLAADAAERHDCYGQSREFWELAKQNAPDGAQLLSIEELRLTLALLLRPANETLEERLRTKLRSYNWRVEGLNSVKRYAILLHRLGRSQDAIDVLHRQISMLPKNEAAAGHELRILEALIAPAIDDHIVKSLEGILCEGSAHEWEQAALKLLLNRAKTTRQFRQLDDFLASIMQRSNNVDFLLTRLQLALLSEAWPRAQDLALKLLVLNDPSLKAEDLQSLWLRLTLEKTPPDYGQIAAMLETAEATRMDTGTKAAILLSLAKHFQNQNHFELAEKFFDLLLRLRDTNGRWDALKNSSMNYLSMGCYDRALERLQDCLANTSAAPDGEDFTFLETFRKAAKNTDDLQRFSALLQEVLDSPTFDQMSPLLARRILLLRAENFYRLPEPDRCATTLDRLLQLEEEAADRTVLPAALLLKAQLMFDKNRDGEANEIVASLRENFPESTATEESYFVCCRRLCELRRWKDAIHEMEKHLTHCRESDDIDGEAKTLLELARLHRENPRADYHGALTALEALQGERFPAEVVYFARAQQAEILREMGDFATAVKVYENLLRDFPGSTDRSLSEYNLAKCYLALARDPSSKWLTRAICLLKKLHRTSIADPNFALEATYSLSLAFGKSRQVDQQELLLWEIWEKYALSREGRHQLNSRGLFWLKAAGTALLEHLDPQLDRPAIDSILLILGRIDDAAQRQPSGDGH